MGPIDYGLNTSAWTTDLSDERKRELIEIMDELMNKITGDDDDTTSVYDDGE